jgi:hypothetical protein
MANSNINRRRSSTTESDATPTHATVCVSIYFPYFIIKFQVVQNNNHVDTNSTNTLQMALQEQTNANAHLSAQLQQLVCVNVKCFIYLSL